MQFIQKKVVKLGTLDIFFTPDIDIKLKSGVLCHIHDMNVKSGGI